MSIFPGAVPPAGSANPNDTLVAAGHTALHNNDRDEIRALATKMGTGASTPASGQVLTSTGAGTSSWSQVNLTTMVSGVLPVANGGTAVTSLAQLKTDMSLNNVDNTSDATKNSASATLTNKTIVAANNTITGLTNSNLSTTTGDLGGAWASWTPTLSNLTLGDGSIDARYIRIGNLVHFRFIFTLGSTSAVSTTGTFTAPILPDSTYNNTNFIPIGLARFRDDNGSNFIGYCRFEDAATGAIRTYIVNVAATYPAEAGISSTVPFNWTTSDRMIAIGCYEV